MIDDPPWHTGEVQYALRPKSEFRYRNLLECIQYLLWQRAFVCHMLWEPVKIFNKDNERIYAEMNAGTWWWYHQVCSHNAFFSYPFAHVGQTQIPVGSTLVPVLLASDQTHLTNFSGDKKLWPVYMSIRNIQATVLNKPIMNAWIPIALLPIPPKRLDKIPTYPAEAQDLDALQITHEILSSILSPLSDAKSQEGIELVCCDEKVRKCIPKFSAWLADHMENVMIHGITSNRCPICIAPPDEFGELPDAPYDTRLHPRYDTAYHNSDVEQLESDGVKNVNNALWHILHCEPHEMGSRIP